MSIWALIYFLASLLHMQQQQQQEHESYQKTNK